MKVNYHTHTWRCNHASGAETEYAKNAYNRGLETLGFSDHTPYLFPGSYYSNFRMRMDQLGDYISTIQSIQKEYTGKMYIPIGLETEFYPRQFPELISILQDYPIDYMILGQHFTHNETDGVYSGAPTYDDDDLIAYCRQVMDAMQTGLFTYVAHPDLIHYQGSTALYNKWMRKLCQESKSCHIPLEFNFLGLSSGRNYPNPAFLEIAAEENCPMILGCDAHTPEALSETVTEQRAVNMLNQYHIPILEDIPLLPIR